MDQYTNDNNLNSENNNLNNGLNNQNNNFNTTNTNFYSEPTYNNYNSTNNYVNYNNDNNMNNSNNNNINNMNNITNGTNNNYTSNNKGTNNKNKKIILIIIVLIIVVAVIVGLFFMAKMIVKNLGYTDNKRGSTSQNPDDKEQTVSESSYHFIAKDYNELSEKEQDEINDKIEKERGIVIKLDGKLLLENPEYTEYSLIGGTYTDNFYKIHYNKNNFLYFTALGKSNVYYIQDSEENFNEIELKYQYSNEASTPSWNLPNKKEYNGWECYYDASKGDFRAYYPLARGYYYIVLDNEKLTDEKAIDNYFTLLSEAIELEPADIKLLDPMIKSDSSTLYTYFNVMNDYYKNFKINDKLNLNLVDNVNVLKWYYNNNWLATNIEMMTKDGKHKYTLRESMKLNDIEDIKNSTSSEFVEYKYKDYDMTLIYFKSTIEEFNGAFMGFIINIDGRNYALLCEYADKSKAVHKGDENIDETIDFMFNQIFVENNKQKN